MRRQRYFVSLISLAMLLLGCGRSKDLSDLEDGAKLQQDCVRLMDQFASGDISREVWPPSVQKLEPIRVTRASNNIRILLRQERGKFSVGYDVFANSELSPSTKGVWVQKTKTKGVYIFKLQY